MMYLLKWNHKKIGYSDLAVYKKNKNSLKKLILKDIHQKGIVYKGF